MVADVKQGGSSALCSGGAEPGRALRVGAVPAKLGFAGHRSTSPGFVAAASKGREGTDGAGGWHGSVCAQGSVPPSACPVQGDTSAVPSQNGQFCPAPSPLWDTAESQG